MVFVEKDQKAPFAGVLFSEQRAKVLRSDVLECDKSALLLTGERSKTDRLNEIIKLKDSEIELYARQNKRLERAESSSNTMNYVWFGLGVVVTGIAVYGASGLNR